jgi:putative transposase
MSNTYSCIYLHYITTVKYRNALVLPEVAEELFKYISGVVRSLQQNLIAINGISTHIHILLRMRANMTPSVLTQKIKSNSSRWINERGFVRPRKFQWQSGGALFSVDYRSVDTVKRYIQNLKAHHRTQTYKEEYMEMLDSYGVPFDSQYLPDFLE